MESNLFEYISSMDYIASTRSIPYPQHEADMFSNNRLTVKLRDVDDFIKKNDAKEVTNPVFFVKDGRPTPDGLLSYELFGITKEDRSNKWGYIDLQGHYLHPLVYKIWGRMDSNIKNIVHGLKSYKIDSNGFIVEDPNGETGLDFLYKNIDKIKIKKTDSYTREKNIDFIMKNKKRLFISKMLVQPAFYRDVLSGKGKVEVGQLNKYYSSLLISARSLRETQDMGFSLGDAAKGRIEETLLSIYKCICGTSENPDDGVGLSGKLGLISGTALAKTVDYGTRLVLSAPELKVETLDDMMTDTEHCALPLASAIINFKPFVVFCIKRFFENEFGGGTTVGVVEDNGKVSYLKAKDPELLFSDDNIEKQINKFVHGFSNRFEPVIVKVEDEKGKIVDKKMVFKGKHITPEQYAAGQIAGESALINRPMTWCDVLYIAANEAVKDKCVLVTRYPIDSAYNQVPQIPRISTIKEMEPIYVNGEFYRWYPRIRKEDIGSNTSNRFIDTLNICNLMIGAMGADYDGDTVGVKGVWIQESNAELRKFMKSKSHYVNFSGTNMRTPSNEAIQSLYNMTKILEADKKKLTTNIQF